MKHYTVIIMFLLIVYGFMVPSSYAVTVNVSGNGEESTSYVSSLISSIRTLVQTNILRTKLSLTSQANTGNNAINDTTGDLSHISTGDVTQIVNVETTDNTNTGSLPCCGDPPAVPEFSFITGILTLLTTGGVYRLLKHPLSASSDKKTINPV